jgi:hypothetical protein
MAIGSRLRLAAALLLLKGFAHPRRYQSGEVGYVGASRNAGTAA